MDSYPPVETLDAQICPCFLSRFGSLIHFKYLKEQKKKPWAIDARCVFPPTHPRTARAPSENRRHRTGPTILKGSVQMQI